jgi:transposase
MKKHIEETLPILNEKQSRIFLASCSNSMGHGGVKKVSEISGFSRTTIIKGKKELKEGIDVNNIRRKGGGRKPLEETYPDLQKWIELLVSEETYGDPENPLLWTTKSLKNIQESILKEHQVYISFKSVATQLKKMGYSLQGNQKKLQVGESHPDRNAQFEYINSICKSFISEGQPVISVDTKKKELIGNFANKGREYRPVKDPRLTLDHDFPVGEMIKVSPYGIYVQNDNTAFVNLGTSHDTSEFAVESISRWWETVGKHTVPNASKLLINCDCGGSNGYRTRLWKTQLQQFSNRTGLELHISHFPPGTSKWNKIEHKLFCYISKNWQGKPLVDIETVVNLISNTTTDNNLKVICKRDDNFYPLSIKVSDEEFDSINCNKVELHGDWNYIISPV